jgi:hypothetical protein
MHLPQNSGGISNGPIGNLVSKWAQVMRPGKLHVGPPNVPRVDMTILCANCGLRFFFGFADARKKREVDDGKM